MSRIDEALRRLTGGVSPEPRNPQSLDRFASEGEVSHKADESRRQAKSEPRKVAFIVPASGPAEPQRAVAPPAAPVVTSVAEAPVQRQQELAIDRVAPDSDVDKLIDVRQIGDYVGFVLHSLRRHKGLTAGMFLGVVVVTALVALLFPRSYHVEVKLLAQRNAVMTALSNPGRAVPWDADAPTRAAAETVLRRDNLISLVTQTDLINEWDRRRSAVRRFRDWVTAKVTGYELTPEDKLDLLVWRLENYMHVDAGPVGDGTVTIELYWPDAEMAYRIVERARQAFLDARQAAETSAISESISILEGYSQTLRENVNKTLSDMRTRGTDAVPADAPVVTAPRPRRLAPLAPTFDPVATAATTADGPAPNPEVARLAGQLRDKQETLAKLESDRQKALSEAQATLGALKTVYTPSHPSVQNAQQKVDAYLAESPQLVALKAQVQELEAKFEAVSTADAERLEAENAKQRASAPATRVAAAPIAREPVADDPPPTRRVSQVTEFANLTFRTELSQLQSILERTDGARIELLVSEAAFKYRYTVIKPAQVPREPESPNLRLIAVAGLFAAILFGVGAAVAKDVISNRIVEAWQVERQLGLPILGTVRLG
jgi:uncharacterized protein involved in exopolysaccharide biosynthesis